MEITDSSYQIEYDRDGDASFSDDSQSLLRDLPACHNIDVAEDMITTDLCSQAGKKEMENKMTRNQLKPHQPANVSQNFKIPGQKVLHKRNGKGETLLHRACQRQDLAQVRVLIQAGISINMEDYAGWTALHEACALGDEAVVEELLKAGADVNARSCDGVTPLHDAVIPGHYEVVQILLQNGSNPSDRNVAGLNALDVAKEENIKELLMAFQASCAAQDASHKALQECRQAAATSSAPGCQQTFSCSSSDTAELQPREAGDGGDVQLRKENTATYQVSHSTAITTLLEEVRTKQTEMSTWPLTDLEDAGRYRAALTQIQSVLSDVLNKQRLEKDALAQRYQRVSDTFRQRVLKIQFHSLASCQKSLTEILQKQMHLEEVYVSWKAKFSTQPPNHQGSSMDICSPLFSIPESCAPGEKQSHHRDREQSLSHGVVAQAGTLGCLQTQYKNAPAWPDLQKDEASAPQAGSTSQHVNFKMKATNSLIQTRAEDNSRYLCRLVEGGVVAPGSALQLVWKGKQHLAYVLADGTITSKGKLHQSPECWLESILGNNIPVSSTYAKDKVTFRDKPLSYYILNLVAKENTSQIPFEDSVEHSSPDASEDGLIPGNLNDLLKKIKIIHLVDDNELLPSALMDYYWDKLSKQSPAELDDWETEL